LLQKIVELPEHSRVVPPKGAAIARSQEVLVEAKSLTKLYFAYRLVQQSLTTLQNRRIVHIADTKAEAFAARALSPYFELIPVWHGATRAKQAELLTRLNSLQPLPDATSAVMLGGVFLMFARELLSENTVFDFDDRPTTYLASREQLRQNVEALGQAIAPRLDEAADILAERGQAQEYRHLMSELSRECNRMAQEFRQNMRLSRRRTDIDVDIPYVCAQFGELCAKGTISALLIRPTRSKRA
jgi:hypothetical protein